MTALRTIPLTPGQATGNRVPLRRRLLEALLALSAGAALLTALAPLPSLRIQLTAWMVFALVLVLCALLDRQRGSRAAASTPAGCRASTALFASQAPMERPFPGACFPSSLGAFNTQDGLDLKVSPESIPALSTMEPATVFRENGDPW
jgi:hypothetical protein